MNNGAKLLHFVTKMQSEYPELSPDKVLIIDFKTLEKIITPARVELIETIRNKNPKSVIELSMIVKRRQEAVSRDLTILHNYGVLEFARIGKTRKPIVEKDIFALTC